MFLARAGAARAGACGVLTRAALSFWGGGEALRMNGALDRLREGGGSGRSCAMRRLEEPPTDPRSRVAPLSRGRAPKLPWSDGGPLLRSPRWFGHREECDAEAYRRSRDPLHPERGDRPRVRPGLLSPLRPDGPARRAHELQQGHGPRFLPCLRTRRGDRDLPLVPARDRDVADVPLPRLGEGIE